ncbi:MAG: TonB-dependent receptor [Alphaproteobacteria bacterium]|nr:MAG: TonB-dependent receptor [Alphaproteobacteria bacterium]
MRVLVCSNVLGRKAMVAAFLLSGASAAYAQTPAAPAPAEPSVAVAEAATDEITVTGSRITRSGFDQPTPVTVIGTADIQAAAPANIADFVNQIPSVAGSVTPANSQRNLSAGTVGVNTINLRNLGSNRTLVLLDGKRSVGSTATGTVDVNTIPQGLVKSVEVVTGGASSVYGSDAVAGVVNFILDRTFTGLKGELSYGETTYGDDNSHRISLTGGFDFADGRGHILINGDYLRRDGVFGAPRPWAERGMHLIQNPGYTPTNGAPELIASERSGLNTTTGGGIITSGVARGTFFGPGGSINQYNYGENRLNNSPWTVGGSFRESLQYFGTSIQPAEAMEGLFGRASFKLFDNFEVFAEGTYNRSKSTNEGGYGTDKANVTIRSDNAFLPAAVRAQLQAAGQTSFLLGTWNADLPTRTSRNVREVQRYLVGFQGDFKVIGLDFNWDGYYQKGKTVSDENVEATNRTQMGFAQDAVLDSSGRIVCRVTRDGSTNPLAAGCVPFNRMGIGVNSPEAVDYVTGIPSRQQIFKQDVAALNFNTKIPNSFVEDIGLAFGIEHRKEQISGTVAPGSESGWIAGNYLATNGSYTVTEGYVETLVPLPAGFEVNGAARLTSYSESGTVVTWKAGLSWQPIDDIRVRVTRSRDIRAPNLSELFQAGSRNTNSVSDPWLNRAAVRYTQTITGNLDLDPEKADTWGLGVVFRPSFAPGFGFSVDYYDIKINGAIGTLGPQAVVDRCFDGNLELCQRLQAVVGGTPIAFGAPGFSLAGGAPGVQEYLIANSPFNFLQNRSRGLDFEASYSFDLADVFGNAPGAVSIRGLATRFLEASESNGIDPATDTSGENAFGGPPKWTFRATLAYSVDDFAFQLVGRGLSSGVYNNQFVECASSCPATNAINRTIANNRIAGAFYLDTYFAYTLPIERVKPQLFLRVNNLLNTDPVLIGKGPSDNSNVDVGINQTLYDFLGRTFRVGLRFNFGG